MSIPKFTELFLPILECLAKKGTGCSYKEQMLYITDYFNLSDDDLSELLACGQSKLYNNTTWANNYMFRAGLLERSKKGVYQITEAVRKLLEKKLPSISLQTLKKYPSFVEFLQIPQKDQNEQQEQSHFDFTNSEKTPDEAMDEAYQQIVLRTKSDILDKIKSCSPRFFERLVVDLLVNMGYGGSRADCAEVVGKSGDGGIDGVIKEDRLGLDAIYIQAKRYENPVPISSVRDFVGALLSKKASKGVFITTSNYSENVYSYISSVNMRIVLIDGMRLAELMMEYDIGVETERLFKIHRINNDYFDEQ